MGIFIACALFLTIGAVAGYNYREATEGMLSLFGSYTYAVDDAAESDEAVMVRSEADQPAIVLGQGDFKIGYTPKVRSHSGRRNESIRSYTPSRH